MFIVRTWESWLTMTVGGWLIGLCMMQEAGAQQTTFQLPVSGGKVACTFNTTNCAVQGKYHAGIDYHAPKYNSVPILASNVGSVHAIIKNGNNDHGMGNCVIVRHAVVVSSKGATATYYTMYAHLASLANGLKAGQVVNRGQSLGMMGATGYGQANYWGSTPHLHFEVKTVGITENPYGGGPYWGYTPKPAQNYGYIDPANVIGSWTAVPLSSKN